MIGCLTLLAAVCQPTVARAQGIYLISTGPVNQGMGGAAVAAPLDSAGALNWNPATISGLCKSEMAISVGFVLPTTSLSSQAFGMSGTTGGESGVTPVPTMSFVLKDDCSPWTWGVGLYGIGGFSSNFPASSLSDPSTANPILTPQPPNGVGVGRVQANAEIYQLASAVSYAFSDKFSVGFAPNIDLANVQADPLLFSPPNFFGGNFIYGPGTGTRYAWGGGFQVGAYYITDCNWRLGASYKSTQWFEPLRYNSTDPNGNPVHQEVNVDLPAVFSIGAAYTGFERLLYAVDVRFTDYENTSGFGDSGFRPDGRVAGLGWRNVVTVANGLQYCLTDYCTIRGGYTFVSNPIPSSQEQFNLGTALIMEHFLSVGGTFSIRENVAAHVAYTHGFEASLSGPYVTPFGAIPNTRITNTTSVDFLTVGLSVRF